MLTNNNMSCTVQINNERLVLNNNNTYALSFLLLRPLDETLQNRDVSFMRNNNRGMALESYSHPLVVGVSNESVPQQSSLLNEARTGQKRNRREMLLNIINEALLLTESNNEGEHNEYK